MTTTESQAGAAHRWWRSLGPVTTETGHVLPGDRATLARLRRCSTVLEAATEPATARLIKDVGFNQHNDEHVARAAALAVALAHVREDARGDRNKIARAIGTPLGREPNDAPLKPSRFRTLMAARTGDEVLTGFRRVVAILDCTAHVCNLAELILGWTDDESGDRVRTRFAFDYYGAGDYAPPAEADHSATIIAKA